MGLYDPTFRFVHVHCRVWPLCGYGSPACMFPWFMQQTVPYAFTPGSVDLSSFISMAQWFVYCNFMVSFEIRQSKFANSLLYRDHSDSSESSAFMLEFETHLWIWGIFEMCLTCGSIWKLLPLYLLLPMYLSRCYDKVTVKSNFKKQDLFWLRAWVYCLLW